MEDLIYDRTTSDVNYAKTHQSDNEFLKGAYNYTDLNRVETWCEYLATELNNVGYSINITTKTDWTMADFPTKAEMERVRLNIRQIMTGYHFITKIYQETPNFKYFHANRWEQILNEICWLMVGMKDWYTYSGVSRVGQPRLWQNRFRNFYSYPSSVGTDQLTTETGEGLTTESNTAIDTESAPYTIVDWIESTGTQYIDTGIRPTNNTRVVTKILLNVVPTSWQHLFGSRDAYHEKEFGMAVNTANWYTGYATTDQRTTTPARTTNTIITIDKNKNVTNISGTTLTNTAGTFTSTYNMVIFALKQAGTVLGFSHYRCYYFKIYEGDTLVRDFIPVLDENGVACFYDKVTEEYFYNQGQGKFVAKETATYRALKYIESTGTQYINSGVTTESVRKIEAWAYNTFGLTYGNKTYGGSLVGARVSTTDSCFQYGSGASNDFIGNGTSQTTLTKNTQTNMIEFSYSKSSYSINCGTYSASGNLSVTISTPLDMYVFGMNNNGTLAEGTFKLVAMNIYDENGDLLRQFVPVIRQIDNAPCLYDLANNTFYANVGTGRFSVG